MAITYFAGNRWYGTHADRGNVDTDDITAGLIFTESGTNDIFHWDGTTWDLISGNNPTDTSNAIVVETFHNKIHTLPKINDTSSNHTYDILVSELAANRTITLPLLTENEIFVFQDFAQTLTAKTMDGRGAPTHNTFVNMPGGELTGNLWVLKTVGASTVTHTILGQRDGGAPATNTATFIGTSAEVDVNQITAGTVQFGLPNDVTIGNDLVVTRNLTVSGLMTTVSTTNLEIEDSTIALAAEQTTGTNTDTLDVGFYGTYRVSDGTRYNGLFRDTSETDKRWKFFETTGSTHTKPGTAVNTGSGFSLGNLEIGVIIVADGAVATPSITNTGDPNTGIYFSAADTVDITVGGTRTATVTAGILDIRNGGTASQVRVYCESSNNHYASLQSALHAAYTGGNATLTLPAVTDTIVGRLSTDTLTNKTINVDNNTVSNIEVDNLKSGVLDTDLSSVAADHTTLASAKAIKALVDTEIGAVDLEFGGDSGTGTVDLSGQTFTVAGGAGLTSAGASQTLTMNITSTWITATEVGSPANFLTIANAATGADPSIAASGETNVGLKLSGKGTGGVILMGGATKGSYLEFGVKQTTVPDDPSAELARMYLKQIDTNNNALCVKIQKAGSIQEVQITSPKAICGECGSADGAKDPTYDFGRSMMLIELWCGHSYEVPMTNWTRVA